MRRALGLAVLSVACVSGPPAPADLDPKNETCSWCRMAVSDARSAGQLVARMEQPLFFDDIGCLGQYLRGAKGLPAGTAAYVSDHRTRKWVPAGAAIYTTVSLETPMGSHLVAHADAASRDADPDAKGGTPRSVLEVFGPRGAPGAAP